MIGRLVRGASLAGVAVLVVASATTAQERYAKVVEAILSAWHTADVVCLGEAHGREYDSELRMALVRAPAFPRTVRTIVVEWGNPVHQDLLDRFILDGVEMSREELAPIWRDASAAEAWESPVYENFLRVVHEVNMQLASERRVRVLGGDRKIDWSKITRAEELVAVVHRGHAIRDLIAEQILDRHVKALAIYGAGHCAKVDDGIPRELANPYGWERVWSVRPLGSDGEVREARSHFRLGDDPEYFVTAGSEWGSMPATGPGMVEGRFTMGEVSDAVVYHGNVPDSVVPGDLSVLRAKYGAELERRERLLLEAFKLWQAGGKGSSLGERDTACGRGPSHNSRFQLGPWVGGEGFYRSGWARPRAFGAARAGNGRVLHLTCGHAPPGTYERYARAVYFELGRRENPDENEDYPGNCNRPLGLLHGQSDSG